MNRDKCTVLFSAPQAPDGAGPQAFAVYVRADYPEAAVCAAWDRLDELDEGLVRGPLAVVATLRGWQEPVGYRPLREWGVLTNAPVPTRLWEVRGTTGTGTRVTAQVEAPTMREALEFAQRVLPDLGPYPTVTDLGQPEAADGSTVGGAR